MSAMRLNSPIFFSETRLRSQESQSALSDAPITDPLGGKVAPETMAESTSQIRSGLGGQPGT